MHKARQTGGGKREDKVRGHSRERCRAFIDATDALRRQKRGSMGGRFWCPANRHNINLVSVYAGYIFRRLELADRIKIFHC